MSNDLVPSPEEFNIYQSLASNANKSQFFSKMGGVEGALCIMLMARELKVGPMAALFGGIRSVQGNVEVSPRLMNTMIRKAGHALEILECTDQICRMKGKRHDTKEEYTATYTLEEARRAGLVRSGGGWEKYPSDMLFARCISRLGRRLFADVISTSYVQGEIEPEEVSPAKKDTLLVVKDILEEGPVSEETQMNDASIAHIEELVGDDIGLLNRILDGYKVEKLSMIPQNRYQAIVNNLQKRKNPSN